MVKERLKKFLPLILATLATVFVLAIYFSQSNNEQADAWEENESAFQQATEDSEKTTEETGKIIVDIKGEVNKPGVYELEGDARVKEVILEAGGLTKQAEEKQLNLAEKLQDQQMIYIPNKEEAEEMAIDGDKETGDNNEDMIDINAADINELQKISGVGPAKAQAIVDYREENGAFESVDELNEISGFGEKTVEKLRDSIKI
ncbi:MAG: helix-hairpin-helix domain-containing protein [Tetragenococcus halophilus]|uniref:helix-hairpin-helix domain-containing protein n=1 Tax=Tetragenococcus halophilus TaxID=51669 RepID=UPI001F30D65D|nr:helix-hairpin-helix domain-containing protein [Tetragenococcus halophilus]MCF1601257.1 helix-hairpin-helix domain-containing protein [Tetragenococcus halophilus]MCF1675002.1 helix-hairpin-helix domain-containing protein [Tetragenococcus halophilus]MDN5831395.1 helix-hairpin-helix domain-containing protein [Tetragenococcus halophilus]MDN6153394.1 helix-hairpin-helix domain-containing protein [Tetragenococcus halophilus]MDN6203040.1 helix-hairpin-helix domain-containing protein [Tetragenococc